MDKAKLAWNTQLTTYTNLKTSINQLMTTMSQKQLEITKITTKDAVQANTLRNEFTSLQNQYVEQTKQLDASKPLMKQLYEFFDASIKALLVQKKDYTKVVTSARQATRAKVVAWKSTELSEYRTSLTSQQAEFKDKWAGTTTLSGQTISEVELKRRQIRQSTKQLEKL